MVQGQFDEAEALVVAAEALAVIAHRGQVDKAGRDYVEHPRRVAARLQEPRARAVAWLHDVLEDTDVPERGLRERGFPDDVVRAVVALTRLAGQDPDDYYAAVARDPLALAVKCADIADNTDPARLAQLDEATQKRLRAKYAHARARLAAHAGDV